MSGYSVEVIEASKELTARERIKLKDTSDAIKLDVATADEPVVIKPVMYAVLNVHNEKAEDKEYKNYVVLDDKGDKYITGSESFFTSFMEIYEEMKNEEEDYSIKIYRVASKNYAGRDFLTCSIV